MGEMRVMATAAPGLSIPKGEMVFRLPVTVRVMTMRGMESALLKYQDPFSQMDKAEKYFDLG